MSLATLPAAFGIEELKKGHYPYFFNMVNNYGKVLDCLPDQKYYNVNHMRNADKFLKWYEENKKNTFDFHKELLEYCISDVEILCAAVKKFIQICQKELHGWNPILNASTIPSFVMHLMKFEHIRPGDVGYVPENGFPKRTQSKLAVKYLLWLEQESKRKIQHVRSGGEKKIVVDGLTCFVDGFVEDTRTIIEVYGCAVHGCPKCFSDSAYNPLNVLKTNGQIHKETMERQKLLENAGYTVETIWEHEINAKLSRNRKMTRFFAQCRHTKCLKPRDAMYGGRVQPFRHIAKAGEGTHLRYLDFCSLYPWVNITTPYPMGQPEVITSDFEKDREYRGVIYCDVLPPTTLNLPVLPYRPDGKLLFPLCRTCAENTEWDKDCDHNLVSQRYLTGQFYTEEIKEAIQAGYKILRYHEIYHWSDEKWQTGGFFGRYLKPLLKMKHEASGWPSWVNTDEDKARYIDQIEKTDGVRLDPDRIKKNPALRSMAKLFLNSAWGKFCENPAQEETEIFKTEDHIGQANFINHSEYEMTSVKDIDGGITLVSREKVEDYFDTKKYANVVFGVITTAIGRLTLYNAMKKVGHERILYCDTDSLVFMEKEGENLLEDLIGTGLGKLESEVPPGFEMTKFVACAPKCYAYELTDIETKQIKHHIKAKGVTLDEENSTIVTFAEMERMATEMIEQRYVDPVYAKVAGMKKDLLVSIANYETIKVVRPVVDKLRLRADGTTVPYGYTEQPLIDDYMFN